MALGMSLASLLPNDIEFTRKKKTHAMQTPQGDLRHTPRKFGQWGAQLAALEQRLKRSVLRNRAALQGKLQGLRRRYQELQLRLREAAHGSTEVEWEDVRSEIDEANHDLRTLAVKVRVGTEKAS